MAVSFRSRLFRLFLLFAAVPAVCLSLAAAYLIFSSRPASTLTSGAASPDVATYYNNYLYDRIDRQLELYAATGSANAALVDFLFVSSANGLQRVLGTPEQLPPGQVDEILRMAANRDHGFAQVGGKLYQFVRRPLTNGGMAYGLLAHEPQLAVLLKSAGMETASRSIEQELRTPYLYFLAALCALLLLLTLTTALVISARVSRSVSRPLLELSEASRLIAGGKFKQAVPETGSAELRELITNFNLMASQLDHATAMLAQTERVAAWRQVARRFAHELRNPLQPILVSLYRIEKQLMDTEAYDKIYEPLKAAADEVRHLTQLADRFSQLAKLPEPVLQEVDLNDLAHSVIELYRDRLAAYRFSVVLPDRPVVVTTDEGYVREALHNLLQNALDATEPGGRIHLEITTIRDRVALAVADSGAGMDASTLASARLPYFTTKEKGTGLGLAIVERAITELGGEMEIVSVKGEGTRATISLPKRS